MNRLELSLVSRDGGDAGAAGTFNWLVPRD